MSEEKTPTEMRKTETYRCPICGKKCEGYKDLKSHIDNHNRSRAEEKVEQKRHEAMLKGKR